jgi:hypothetical protein
MANFNSKAFMDSLTADMQEKVKACKTAEELQTLIEANNIDLTAFAENGEDAELSFEDLDGVAGGRGLLQTAVASVIMFTSAGAAIANPSSVGGTIFADSAITASADFSDDVAKKTEEISEKIGDLAMEKAKKKGLEFLDKGLDALLKNVPFASDIKNLIMDELLSAFGLQGEKPITMKDLSKKLDKLDEKIDKALDAQTKKLISELETTLTKEKYTTDLQDLANAADISNVIKGSERTAQKYGLSEEDQLVKLAMIVGNSNEWSREGSFIMAYKKVTSDLISNNYYSNKDIFTVLYDKVKGQYMFSGEALDAINPYIQKMIYDYMKYTTVILASLDAQMEIISDDFDPDKMNDPQLRKQYDNFLNSRSTIEDMKIKVAQRVFGSEAFLENGFDLEPDKKENYDNVFAHYEKFMSMDRLIHIPTGRHFKADLTEASGAYLISNDYKATEQFACDRKESTSKSDFADRIQGKTGNYYYHNCIDEDQMKSLFTYISAQINCGNAKDVLDFLKQVGFNTDKVVIEDETGALTANRNRTKATGTYFLTGGGYEEIEYDAKLYGTSFYTCCDTIDLKTGAVENKAWQSVYNRTAINEAINGDEIYSYGNYLFFNEASEAGYVMVKGETNRVGARGGHFDIAYATIFADCDFYYENNADLQQAFGKDQKKLLSHYYEFGIKEGRAYSKGFDPKYYLENNPDVAAACKYDYGRGFEHFLAFGVEEGRKASPYYDEAYYVKNNPELASLSHYQRWIHFMTTGDKTPGVFGSEYDKQKTEEMLNTIKNWMAKFLEGIIKKDGGIGIGGGGGYFPNKPF